MFIIKTSNISRLMDIGEQFCRNDSNILHEAMRQQSVVYFRSYHNGRLEELKMFLENETWQSCPVKSTFHITQLHVNKKVFKNFKNNRLFFFRRNFDFYVKHHRLHRI